MPLMTPIERALNTYSRGNRTGFGATLCRLVWFFLVQMLVLIIFFWAGIFTLIAALWHGNPNYIWIFLLLVSGFELLALRIVWRQNLLTAIGVILLACGIWFHYQDSANYNERTCHFIKNSNCREFGDGFICRQETSSGMILERLIERDDIRACGALDEL